MMTTTKEASLEDSKTRYGTPGDALYLAGIQTIKDHYKNILPISTIQDFLAKSRSYTLHYNFKRAKSNPYYIRKLRQMIQIDLTDFSKISKYNSGFKCILVAVECFSRKIWVRLLKTKTADEVLTNLQSILKETGYVESIGSDRGNEFVNKKMRTFFNDSNAH